MVASHPDDDEWVDSFRPVQADRIRVVVLAVNGTDPQNSTPSLYEIEVFEAQPPADAPR